MEQVEPSTWTNRVKVFVRQLCQTQGLNVFFASLCVIDLFGVFPIVALPGAIISCGYYYILILFICTFSMIF